MTKRNDEMQEVIQKRLDDHELGENIRNAPFGLAHRMYTSYTGIKIKLNILSSFMLPIHRSIGEVKAPGKKAQPERGHCEAQAWQHQ